MHDQFLVCNDCKSLRKQYKTRISECFIDPNEEEPHYKY